MLVSNTTLELAFWKVLNRHHAEAGGTLPFTELERDWSDTGLRHGDLRDAVRMTLESGWIECVPDNSGLALRLTANGYRDFYRRTEAGMSLATFEDHERVLEEARRRPRAGPPADGRLRRAEDNGDPG